MTSADRTSGGAEALAAPNARRILAMGLMVASSTAISFGGLIMRNIEHADAWQINLYRSVALIVAVSMIIVSQYRGRAISYVLNIGWAGLGGGAMLAIAGIAFLQALTHTTVANTLFTLSAIPFITAAIARVVLKERLESITFVTMIGAAIGILVMVAGGIGAGSLFGNAMALATAFFFSGFAVVVRRNRGIDMLPTLLVSGAIIAAVALVLKFGDLEISPTDLFLCVLWGGVLSGFANALFIVASRHLVAAEVTLFMLLEFALGPLWVWLFVGETPTHWTLTGGGLVLTSVMLRAMLELRRTGRRLRRGRLGGPS